MAKKIITRPPKANIRWSYVALRQLYWLSLVWIIPLIVWWRVEKRRAAGNVQ